MRQLAYPEHATASRVALSYAADRWRESVIEVFRVFPRLLYREGSRNDGDSGLLLRSAREFFGRQIVE